MLDTLDGVKHYDKIHVRNLDERGKTVIADDEIHEYNERNKCGNGSRSEWWGNMWKKLEDLRDEEI